MRCSQRGSIGSTPSERSALALGAVAGDAFETRCGPRPRRRHHARRARAGLRSAGQPRSARAERIRGRRRLAPLPAQRSCERPPTPRSRSRRALGCTSARRPGSTGSEATCRMPTPASRSTSRPPAATSARSAAARPTSSRPAPGRRLAAAAWVARGRGDLLGEIGFLDRAIALLGTDEEQGAALLPALVSALFEAGVVRSSGAARGSSGVDERLARPAPRRGVVGDRARADPALPPPDQLRRRQAADGGRRAGRRRRSADWETTSRSGAPDYLMADLAWLTGDPVASYAHAERMLVPRAARGERLRRRDGAHVHGLGARRGAVADR